MKISNIKNNNFLVLKNNKTFKKNIFKQSCDILDINFGARNKNKEESSKVQEVFKNDFMAKQAVNEIIRDKNGKYQTEVEEIFLETYLDMLDLYKEDDEDISENFELNLQEATIETFKALKRKDGSFNLGQNVPSLIITALEAIENNVYGVDEIFDYCKYEDESICEELAQIICEQKMYYPNISNQEMFYMFSNYFIDNKTGILDTNTIPMLLSLFSQADAKNLSQTDNLYSLVIDENGEFNEERYEFAYNALAQLQKIKQKEISKKSQNEDQVIISAMITSITGAIMESVSLENKGKFNMQKAQNLLDYLLDNINKVGTLYKNEGLQPISLTPQNMTFERGSTFNSKLYKLFILLCS